MIWLNKAKQFLGAMGAHDFDTLHSMVSEDFVVYDIPFGDKYYFKDFIQGLKRSEACSGGCIIQESAYKDKTIFINYSKEESENVIIIKFNNFGKIFEIRFF